MQRSKLTRNSSFNPRPPRKVGATVWLRLGARNGKCFNPRPPRKVGATSLSRIRQRSHHVSILAHPERWALQWRRGYYVWATNSFNPRPPRKVGATSSLETDPPEVTVVSILAHPERWALHTTFAVQPLLQQVSILAHPERWALLRQMGLLRLDHLMFQSSPTPKGGRYA